MSTADRFAAPLSRDGWCVIERALDPSVLAGIERDFEPRFAATPLCHGAFYGERTRRFGSLLTRSDSTELLVMHRPVPGIVEQMLLPWCERITLNLAQAIQIHPGALPQFPHRDQDMWQGPKGSVEFPYAGQIGAIMAGSRRGKRRDQIRSSGHVAHSLEAALWCVGRTSCFADAVLLGANLGDDADTTAAITGQVAGALYGAGGIPDRWLDQLAWRERIGSVQNARPG